MNNAVKPYQFLNRDVIKYFAIFAMLCNHLSKFFMMELAVCNQRLLLFCDNVGTFTAITMIYFLVEGYAYTRSKKNYITRLLIFALISQIAWNFAFPAEGQLWSMGRKLNMIFTLCICFGIIYVLDTEKNIYIKTALVILGIYLSQYCDWAWFAPLYTIAFVWGRKSKTRQIIAAVLCLLIYLVGSVAEILPEIQQTYGGGITMALSTIMPCAWYMIAALICILFLYNGKQMKTGKTFSKWFFYIFYPAHLVILRVIDLFIHGLS